MPGIRRKTRTATPAPTPTTTQAPSRTLTDEELARLQAAVKAQAARAQERRASLIDERSKQAWKSVRLFTEMLPQLTAFARIVSGDPRVRVRLGNQGAKTDGTDIWIMPNIALGDERVHQAWLCDKRGPNKRQLCPACDAREVILFFTYHEVAHVAFKSFEKPTQPVKDEIRNWIKRDHPGCDHEQNLLWRLAMEANKGYLDLFAVHNGFLPILHNCLEDARVNARMFKARPGLKILFEAATVRVFEDGCELPSGQRSMWRDAPLNSQIMIGLFLTSSGYQIEDGSFKEVVTESLSDPELMRLSGRVGRVDSVHGVAEIALEMFERLNVMGYCLTDRCAPPPPIPSLGNPSDEGDEPGEANQPSATGEKGNSENSGHEDASKPNPETAERGEDGHLPDGASSDPAVSEGDDADQETGEGDPSEGSDGGESAGGSGVGAGEDSEQRLRHGSGDDDGEAEGPGSPEADDNFNPDDDEVREPQQGAGGGGTQSEDEGSEDGAGDGDTSSDVNRGTGDIEGDAPDDENRPDQAASGDSAAGNGADGGNSTLAGDADTENDSSDSDRSSGERSSEGSTGRKESGEDGAEDGEEDGSSDDGDSGVLDEDGFSSSDDDGDGWESDAEGSDGRLDGLDERTDASVWDDDEANLASQNQWHSEPDPSPGAGPGSDYGSPTDVAEIVKLFGGHEGNTPGLGHTHEFLAPDQEHSHGEDSDNDGDSEDGEHIHVNDDDEEDKYSPLFSLDPEDQRAIEKAVGQYGSFDDPRVGVAQIAIVPFPTDQGYCRWYDRRAQPSSYAPSETIMGQALMTARLAFEANRRATEQRNQKTGKLDSAVLGRRAPFNDPRIMKRKLLPTKHEEVVVIGVDCSGSTDWYSRNPRIIRAVYAQAELLSRLGVKFGIWGMSGGEDLYGTPNDLPSVWIMPIKEIDGPWDNGAKTRLTSLRPMAGNFDGHNIEFLHRQLRGRREAARTIIYYTDGEMPAANYDEELAILVDQLQVCSREGTIVLGVGINTDSPRQYGLDTVQVDSDNDIVKVVEQLGRRLKARR